MRICPTNGIIDKCYVVGEVPIRVGSPEVGSHEGASPRVLWTDGEHMKYGNLHIRQRSLLLISCILSFLFFSIFLICPFPPCGFEFS